ncbi:MAG: hypothetical protein CM15mP70_18190 [Pelagibacteraceae bacterium]|nr:MAG: hypothetical protein CM15mP70_18190 [Pelagibacteraceae bacterium]
METSSGPGLLQLLIYVLKKIMLNKYWGLKK